MQILANVISDIYGQLIYSEQDLCDIVMQGHDIAALRGVLVTDIDLGLLKQWIDPVPDLVQYQDPQISVTEFDRQQQQHWLMPQSYHELDIAEHVLSMCNTAEELQRCGQELLLYQERGLFDLLRYLKYLVDVMQQNNIVWGVGRGSSVSSYVLYLLKIHKINSMYYDLDVGEFLR